VISLLLRSAVAERGWWIDMSQLIVTLALIVTPRFVLLKTFVFAGVYLFCFSSIFCVVSRPPPPEPVACFVLPEFCVFLGVRG
jgi:hypothetical protein